jgi:hypothetical protein
MSEKEDPYAYVFDLPLEARRGKMISDRFTYDQVYCMGCHWQKSSCNCPQIYIFHACEYNTGVFTYGMAGVYNYLIGKEVVLNYGESFEKKIILGQDNIFCLSSDKEEVKSFQKHFKDGIGFNPVILLKEQEERATKEGRRR